METCLKTIADNVCRTCMCKSTNMISLFSKTCNDEFTLSQILNFLTNIDIREDDALPKYVCEECQVLLNKTGAFRKVCLETNSKFITLINDRNKYANNIINIEVKDEVTSALCMVNGNKEYECENCLEKFQNLPLFDMHKDICYNDKKDCIDDFTMPSPTRDSVYTPLEPNDDYSSNNFEEIKQEMYEDFMEVNVAIDVETRSENSSINEQLLCVNNTMFSSIDEFKRHILKGEHIKQDVDEKNTNNVINLQLKCQKCMSSFSNAKSYMSHQKQYHNTLKYQCSLCERKFKKKTSLANHIRRHEDRDKAAYTCTTCKREFQHQAHLDNHILSTHTREKGFKCEICFKNFKTKDSLEVHIDGHKIEKKYRCETCDKAFTVISTLKEHMRSHTGEKPYLCSTCGKSFSQANNLKQHVKRHQGLKEFKCEKCEKRFVSKGELVAHNRRHTGAHPFICDDCGSGFTTSSSLGKHRRIHTGERPYACDLCPMRFSASGTLRNHRRTHTNERPHKCTYCEKAFVQRSDMVAHVRCHTGDRPYVCPNCGQAFRKTSNLKSHIKTHLKEQKELSMLQEVNVVLSGIQVEN